MILSQLFLSIRKKVSGISRHWLACEIIHSFYLWRMINLWQNAVSLRVGTHLRSADSTFLLRDQVFQIDIIQLNLLHELWDEKPYIDNEVKMLCTKIALCSLRSGAHNCECDGTRNVFAQTARQLRCDNDKEQIDRVLNCDNRNTFDLCIVLEYISTKHSNEHKD